MVKVYLKGRRKPFRVSSINPTQALNAWNRAIETNSETLYVAEDKGVTHTFKLEDIQAITQ